MRRWVVGFALGFCAVLPITNEAHACGVGLGLFGGSGSGGLRPRPAHVSAAPTVTVELVGSTPDGQPMFRVVEADSTLGRAGAFFDRLRDSLTNAVRRL